MLTPQLAKACGGGIGGHCAVAELWCCRDFRDIVGSLREQGALAGRCGYLGRLGRVEVQEELLRNEPWAS